MSTKSIERKSVPLFMILLVLSLAYFVSTAFLFHVSNVKDAEYYSAEWFLENSHAIIPTFPLLNITPPNYTLQFSFEVVGDARTYGWRFIILSEYATGKGWVVGNLSQEPYLMNTTEHFFLVRLLPLPIEVLRSFPLVTLWDVMHQRPIISSFSPYISTVSHFECYLGILKPDDIVTVDVSSPEEGLIGFRYLAHFTPTNFHDMPSSFSKVNETKTEAQRNSAIRDYLKIPSDYFSMYPKVLELVENVSLPPERSVYDQLTSTLAYIFANFELRESINVVRDPVADFIENGGGPPTGFVNVTAFILRALGIPTRIVIGFIGGGYSKSTNTTTYSLENLAAWIEIWDKNIGWIPIWVYPLMFKVSNILAPITAQVQAPRTIENYPAARINESITINVSLEGNFSTFENTQAEIYDLNASLRIGSVVIRKIGEGKYGFSFDFSYDAVYSGSGMNVVYGRHVIVVRMHSVYLFLELVLLRMTTISS
ncbi:MAG: transglutaminase-like domain-containing protein [Crenarchaeota archaeon]|nr:transglutaminase-like domain-containing protein [Thermoproteota archaeon]MCR8453413.1 transglutaminase-like domain-containing protein [Thermoproteota archaeon]MCR8463145.1 transglutaminase-like domain-containing protein [Thermoproteota archaeon]MCR8471020.1 transglutaminase-like domain-containing protein [Thermoproteota archaeon]MCR8471836.1 transglutaminase-like domain-containing protein [Thermoproteota archaeon]